MADFVFTEAKKLLWSGGIDLNTDDIRVLLCMSNNTVDANQEANNLVDMNLDEHNGSGYARVALTGETISEDPVNHWSEFRANNVSFGAVGAGSRSITRVLIYKHVNVADGFNIPIAKWDRTAVTNGSVLTLTWNVLGLLRLA